MRGNITRRGKSSWRLKYDVGTDSDRQIAYVTVRGTRKQAEAELAKRLNELKVATLRPQLRQWKAMLVHWLANIAPAERSPLTLERYTSIIRRTSFLAWAQFHCKLSTVRPSTVSMRIVANKGDVTAPD